MNLCQFAKYVWVSVVWLLCAASHAQNTTYLAAEILAGGVVPNYRQQPPSGLLTGVVAHWVVQHYNNDVADFFNNPRTGLALGAIQQGNNALYGHQYFLVPYVALRMRKQAVHPAWFRVGLGAAWLTKHHRSVGNTRNLSVGSSVNFAFQVAAHKEWVISDRLTLKAGLHYLHASNAHVQLPNFGLNAAAISVQAAYQRGSTDRLARVEAGAYEPDKPTLNKPARWYLNQETGCGLHEYGGTTGPVGRAKRPVFFSTLSVAKSVRPGIQLKTGFGYRFYEHYYRDVTQNRIAGFSDRPVWSASNIYLLVGSEFLFDRVGIDVQGGLNLHKPFFKYFYQEYEDQHKLDYTVKQLFNSQLGINFYMFKQHRQPRFNVSVGGQVNANFGQADFGSVKLATYYRL
jgi:hypothetical protein